MIPLFHHHRKFLETSRLVYQVSQPSNEPANYVQGRPSAVRANKELAKGTSDALGLLELFRKKSIQLASEYNRRFTRLNSTVPYEKPIPARLQDPSKALQIVEAAITSIERSGSTGSQAQKDFLKNLQKSLQETVTQYKKLQSAESKQVDAAIQRIEDRLGKINESKRLRTSFEKSPYYRSIEGTWDSQFSGLRNTKFATLYRRVDGQQTGIVSTHIERSHKQLFLSIMAEMTQGFQNKIAFPEMGKDWKANRDRYPFLYQKWVEKNGLNLSKVTAAKSRVNNTKEELKGVPNLDEITANINNSLKSLPATLRDQLKPLKNPLLDIPAQPDNSLTRSKRERALNKFKDQISTYLKVLKNNPKGNAAALKLEGVLSQIDIHLKLESAYFSLRTQEERNEAVNKKFTKADLLKSPAFVNKVAMLQFAKAVEIVDSIYKLGNIRNTLNPAARRMLIAAIFKQGVANYNPDQGGYNENVRERYKDLLGIVAANSPQFNNQSKEKFLTNEQRGLLTLGLYANFVKAKLKSITQALQKTGLSTTRKDQLTTQKSRLENFQTQVVNLIENNDPKKALEFINKLAGNDAAFRTSLGIDNNTLKDLQKTGRYLNAISFNYSTLDLKHRNEGNILEKLGIHFEGVYQAYTLYLKKNPQLKVTNWDHLITTEKGVAQLTKMFQAILPKSSTFGGREDFIIGLRSLQGKKLNRGGTTLKRGERAVLAVFNMLKIEVQNRESTIAARKSADQNTYDKLDGESFGDRVTDYVKGVFNMLTGPGQSVANRAAGLVLTVALYKLAMKAYSGEGASGKMLRLAFLGAAVEIGLKNITGEGLTDKMKMSGLSRALANGYENVLLNRLNDNNSTIDARNKGPDYVPITKTEHSAALVEMRGVPMHQLIEWYENTDVNGNPLPGKKAKLPGSIDVDNIIRGAATRNKESRGRLVIKAAMRNFFGYVGNKVGRDHTTGKQIVKEVWVTSLHDSTAASKSKSFARRGLPQITIDQLRGNPNRVTWLMAVEMEVKNEDFKKSNGKSLLDYAKDATVAAKELSQDFILNPTTEIAKEFWRNIDERYKKKMQDFLKQTIKAGASGFRYVKDGIYFAYKGNQYEIRKFGRDSYELLGNAAKLPFQIIYGLHQGVVPFVNMKLRQTTRVLTKGSLSTLRANETLSANNILSANLSSPLEYMDHKKNPQFMAYGMYQYPFAKAMRQGRPNDYPKVYTSVRLPAGQEKWQLMEGFPDNQYLIMKVTPQEAGVNSNDSPTIARQKMQSKMYEKTVKYLMRANNMQQKEVVRYLSKIHQINKASGSNRNYPQAIYGFFRFPGGKELELKRAGRWPDYMDANSLKYRPPFMIDPKKGILENLYIIYGGRNPIIRKSTGYIGTAVGQWMRLLSGTAQVAGNVLKTPIGLINQVLAKARIRTLPSKWINVLTNRNEKTMQAIDEITGNARDPRLATSRFYKNSKNSKIYNKAYAIALRNRSSIDLNKDEDGNVWPWSGRRQNQ